MNHIADRLRLQNCSILTEIIRKQNAQCEENAFIKRFLNVYGRFLLQKFRPKAKWVGLICGWI